MAEVLGNERGKDFKAPQAPVISSPGHADINYRKGVARAFDRDIKSLRESLDESSGDEALEGELGYAEMGQAELTRLSGAKEAPSPSQFAVGLGCLMGKGERTQLTMLDIARSPGVDTAEGIRQATLEYSQTSSLIIETGQKLYPDANTDLSSDNYESILQAAGSLSNSEKFGSSSVFKDGITKGGVEFFANHPDKNYATNLEKHLGEIQFGLMAQVDGEGKMLMDSNLDKAQQAELSNSIANKSKLVYQILSMRNELGAVISGREDLNPVEAQQLQDVRSAIDEADAGEAGQSAEAGETHGGSTPTAGRAETEAPSPDVSTTAETSAAEDKEVSMEHRELAAKLVELMSGEEAEIRQAEANTNSQRISVASSRIGIVVNALQSVYGTNTEKFYARVAEMVGAYVNAWDDSDAGRSKGIEDAMAGITSQERDAIDQARQAEKERQLEYTGRLGYGATYNIPREEECIVGLLQGVTGKKVVGRR